ncbi:phage tail tape measure protein [Dehalococcoides sp.]|jgi:CRISPR/Cas system CSM-associated protein Csm2 small subunit|uniref:phage tail tape measure protein n=1 Tax=Dehalococcoides sp. TaxID=1966486 RepID=UPI003565BA09
MAGEIGKLFVTLSANTTDFADKMVGADKSLGKLQRSIDATGQNFQKLGLKMAAVGGAMIGSLGLLVNKYAEAGDEIAKMAKRTGFGAESLSELKYAAEMSGASLTDLEGATKKMSKSIVDASEGSASMIENFEYLNLSVEALRELTPEEQFWAIANAMSELEDQTLQASIAQDIFGGSGTNLLPLLAESKDNIAALRQEAHDLNMVYSEESATAAEQFQDSKERLVSALQGIGVTIAETVMPKITELINSLTEKLKPAMAWLSEHPEVVDAFTKFGAVFLAGGALMLGISQALKAFRLIKMAIMGVNAALVFMHSLTGVGIAKALAGLAIGAGAIIGMNSVIDNALGSESDTESVQTQVYSAATGTTTISASQIPAFALGGTVPGPIGAPTLALVHGGEEVIPVGQSKSQTGQTVNISINNPVIKEEADIDRLTQQISEKMQRVYQRNLRLAGA